MVIEKVSIIGLGAVGCTVAPYIISYLPEKNVRIIAGGKRKERLEQNGIIVNNKHYDCYVTAPEENVEPADLLIVAVKYASLPQAVIDMRNHIGPNTIILSLMNGVDSREIIGEKYGIEKCIYGICSLSTINYGDGTFKVSPKEAGILIGEAHNTEPYTERLQAVVDLFTSAGIEFKVPEDMIHDMWWKFLLNVGGNCTNTVLRGSHSYFQQLAPANAARRMIMEEALSVAIASGATVSMKDVDELMDIYKVYPPENTCSMLQDFMLHKKTENDMLCGYVVKLGKKYNIPTPVNQYVYYILSALDEVNAGADVVRVDNM
ncbi:MAG: ketopantoate reductase family protein [Lachnospiraceae bacterium]|nr:ketopantoate reductase family protein [Lachnospiraceae bacterium]